MMATEVSPDSVVRWHMILGHMASDKLKKWMRSQGLQFTEKALDAVRACESCHACKGPMRRPGRLEEVRGRFFNDVVSLDLMVIEGCKIPILYMQDDFSRYARAVAIEDKRAATVAKAFTKGVGTE